MRKIYLLLACLMFTSVISNAMVKYVGGDISLLPKYEERGARYLDENGNRVTDVLGYLKSNSMNAMRVRLFVDPSQDSDKDRRVISQFRRNAEHGAEDLLVPLVFSVKLSDGDHRRDIDPQQPGSTCCWTSITATPGPTQVSTARHRHGQSPVPWETACTATRAVCSTP